MEVWTWRLDRGSMSGTGFNPGLANIDLDRNDFHLVTTVSQAKPFIAPSKILPRLSFTLDFLFLPIRDILQCNLSLDTYLLTNDITAQSLTI